MSASLDSIGVPAGLKPRLEKSFDRVVTWVQAHEYRAYEPADGNSSLFYPLTMGKVPPMRVLQQVVLRAPFNIRPFLGVRPHESSIGLAYMAWAYLVRYRTTGDARITQEARRCLDWLMANRAAGYDEYCWGDPYEYATRSGRRPKNQPTLIWSSLIGLVFVHAYETLEDARYLDVARSVGNWMLALPAEKTATGICLSYVTYRQNSIHNASVMGAAFLARLARITGSDQQMAVAREAALYTCARIRDDGSWYYAEEPKYHWVDNFHTGYNLVAVDTYRKASGDASFDDVLARGMSYFTHTFFEPDGRPKYFHDRTSPVDIQCAAQAIETLIQLADLDPHAFATAMKVADWTIGNMQASDGHFYYRDLGWTKIRTPMLHWGQGTMAKALAVALESLDARG
jgi:rhamnogalacturonyl hydrolase YesR